MRKLPNESGQALIVVALAMTLLIGFVGIATDVGLLFIAKRKLQAAADCAATAGAAELNYGDYTTAAQAAAAQNGFTNGANGVTIQVNPNATTPPSPLYGAYKNQSGYLEVILSQSEPTYFMKVFSWTSMTISARAVAALGSNPNCFYALAGSGTSVTLSNGATLSGPTCGMVVNSSSSTAVNVGQGSKISVATIGIVGNSTVGSGGTVSPTPVTGIVPVSDPLAYLSPPSYNSADCTADPQSNYGNGVTSYTIGPGSAHSTLQGTNLVCYTSLDIADNNFSVTLNPGIYVVTGGLTFASGGSTHGGDGVMFYLPGTSALSIANGAEPTLSAPTSGTYNGILFYQDRSNSAAASIQGGASSVLKGILYFPDASLTLGNGSTTATYYTPVVSNSLTMYGGSNFTVGDYGTLNSANPITSARLVE